MVMKRFYFMVSKRKELVLVLNKTDLEDESELFKLIERKNKLPFSCVVKKYVNEIDKSYPTDNFENVKLIWADFIGNIDSLPMFSKKMKNVIDNYLTSKNNIHWKEAKVDKFDGENRTYYLPWFNEKMDVLDNEKTTYKEIEGHKLLFTAYYDYEKVKDLHFFHKPNTFYQLPTAFYVSEELKNEIEKQQLTGVEFEPFNLKF